MNKNTVLTANNISKKVKGPNGTLEILNGINLSILEGETVSIMGPSGSGKSTLISILAGLDTSTSGEVIIQDENISRLSEEARSQIRNLYTSFIFQSFHLLPSLTALENVSLPLEIVKDVEAENKARKLMEEVGLSHRLSHYPKHLSGGEKQRVAIARALSTNPKILFADEPTGNLDQATGKTILELLFKLNQSIGTAILLVTHDLKAALMCNRMIQIVEGQIK
jgi:putative ABC transport system ATP-binding protein